MTNYLAHLKLSKQSPSNRWVVKYGTDHLICEVKLLFNPKEYKTLNPLKRIYTRKTLIKILENDKKNRQAE